MPTFLNTKLNTIHRPVLRLTAIICILTVMLWAARSQLSGRVYPSLLSSSHFGPPYLSYSPLSRIENHAAGRWARRESPILTQNDMSSLMPGMKYTHQTCEGGLARLYKIASWEWLGQDGSRLEFDAKRFLVDLLRRQAGLFFIGDSISTMNVDGVKDILAAVSEEYQELYHTKVPLYLSELADRLNSVPRRVSLSLNPKHPATENLLQEAGVGAWRLEYPLVTGVRADYLATDVEMMERILTKHGLEFKKPTVYNWLPLLTNYTSLPSTSHQTMVVVNTGAHFGVLPMSASGGVTDEAALAAIDTIIKEVYQILASMSNIRVVVRTSYPGEVDCKNYTVPSTDTSKSNINVWGWHRMIAINELLRAHMPLLNAPAVPFSSDNTLSSSLTMDGTRLPALLLDVETQGRLRPDARFRPVAGDCLHMCRTAIAEDWGRWQAMVMREEAGQGWGV